MKVFFIAMSFLFVGISFSQTKDEVDNRLIENQGTEIYNILQYQKDYYKFLLWELDNGYHIINKSDVLGENLLPISNIVDKNGLTFNPDEVNNPDTFNFIKYNFVRQKEVNAYYDLGNGKVLALTSLSGVWEEFRKSKQK